MTDIIITALSIVVGVVFIKSSYGKIKNPFAFQKVLEGYSDIFKKSLVIIPILILGPLEFLIGLSLILNIKGLYIYMTYLGIMLQLLFLTMMVLNYNRVLPFGCGCFGLHTPEKITNKKIVSNLTILMAGILIAFSF